MAKNLDDYVEQKVDSICCWTRMSLRDAVILAMKEAMRDQRYGDIAAINSLAERWPNNDSVAVGIVLSAAEQLVMNALPEARTEEGK